MTTRLAGEELAAQEPGRQRDARTIQQQRQRTHRALRLLVVYVVATVIAVICLVPVVWMVKTSFESTEFIRGGQIQFWPIKPTLDNYRDVLGNPNAQIFRSMLNSIVVAFGATVFNLTVTALAGYALSRFDFRGKLLVAIYVLLFYMIPRTLILIGMFVILSRLHLLNTLMGLVLLYAIVGMPLAIWWLKGYFDSIPVDIEEQAMVDGCTRVGALRRIIAPLAAPGIAAVGIFLFVDSWNEFMMALTMISSPELRTLPVQIVNFMGMGEIQWGPVMAFSVIVATPAVILFAVVQRQMVSGLMSGFSK